MDRRINASPIAGPLLVDLKVLVVVRRRQHRIDSSAETWGALRGAAELDVAEFVEHQR